MFIRKLFKPTIPVIHIDMGIDAKAVQVVEHSLKAIRRPKALAIVLNSKGGFLIQAELIVNKLKLFAKDKAIPIYTFADDEALSAAYFILAIGDKVFVDRASQVGSVGVMMLYFKLVETLKNLGIESRFFTSNEHLVSNQHPFVESNPELSQKLKAMGKVWHKNFIEHVAQFRPQIRQQSQEVQDLVWNANIFSGADAVKFGLADHFGRYQDVLQDMYPDCAIQNVTQQPLLQRYLNKQFV